MADLVHNFDWYQATVPAQPSHLLEVLHANLPEGIQRTDGKGFNSFAQRADLHNADGEVFVTAMWGGVNKHPHAKASGDHAPALAEVLRHAYPVHRVSRLDVAVDGRGDDLFERCVALMSSTGREHRLKGEKIIPDDLDDGSTYYLGARTSPLRVRCYEKGKQLYKLTGDPVWRQFFDWTRIELQVRPEKQFKETASRMQPADFWGCSAWTRDIAAGVLAMSPDAVTMRPTRIADHERAMRALVAQYGPTLLRQVEKLGSWDAVMDDLRARLGHSDVQQAA